MPVPAVGRWGWSQMSATSGDLSGCRSLKIVTGTAFVSSSSLISRLLTGLPTWRCGSGTGRRPAITHLTGVVLGQRQVPAKRGEGTVIADLLAGLRVTGMRALI
jgi:hypothetical protein